MYLITVSNLGCNKYEAQFTSEAETMACAISEGLGFCKGRCNSHGVSLTGIGDGEFVVEVDSLYTGGMTIKQV